jgi:hypothetical protein
MRCALHTRARAAGYLMQLDTPLRLLGHFLLDARTVLYTRFAP